jgi:hypothetical protein
LPHGQLLVRLRRRHLLVVIVAQDPFDQHGPARISGLEHASLDGILTNVET